MAVSSIRGAANLYPGFGGPNGKVFPEHLAGMIGLPSVGNLFYVDPGSGSDTANDGSSSSNALATLSAAITSMTADQDDVTILNATSSTGRTSEAATSAWSKRRTHLVGNGPLRKVNPRNGVSYSALSGSDCFTVSATNCSFTNVSIASFNDNNILVDVTAAYNTFNFVHFQGIGDATAGDDAAARSLRITAADETIINNCTIGLDTIARSAANSSVELTGTVARTLFSNCDFPMFADAATPTWLLANTGNCYERYLKFENCFFTNPTNASSTALTNGMTLSSTGNGDIFLDIATTWRGATDLASDYTNLYTSHPVVDTANQGLRIINAT